MKVLSMLTMMSLVVIFNSDTTMVNAQIRPKTYQLVFADEFNQRNGSQPDSTKWSRSPRNQAMWARWNSDSKRTVFIRNGKLVCRAIPNNEAFGDSARMLTGAIRSKGKYAFQYGKVEVRLRTNLMEGNFPAVWMRPENDGTPPRYGEFDIFEAFGADGIAHQTVHSHRSATLKKEKTTSFVNKISINKWHIYGLEWTPSYILFTIDGRTVGIYQKSTDKAKLAEGQWTFDRPFFMILNQSVGTKTWHTPDVTKVYETQFDWIRVYQLK
ncbi:MAG: glycoside hydrolase family 16 protein [Prevotella sp.]